MKKTGIGKKSFSNKNMKLVAVLVCIFSLCLSEHSHGNFEGKGLEPTIKDVSYGPCKMNTLNFWQVVSDKPVPVVIKIHSGGWLVGAKDLILDFNDPYINSGIAVVSIDYRLTADEKLPAPVYDAARAIQFVRWKAKEWNIDKNKVAVVGGSAGGCTALWLALYDDLKDPAKDDPVERESTKPTCAATWLAQTCLDPIWIIENIGFQALKHSMIYKSLGAKSTCDLLENEKSYKGLIEMFSPILHIDKDDPPIYLEYKSDISFPAKNQSHGIHHGNFGIKLKERAEEIGYDQCYLNIIENPSSKSSSLIEFVKKELLE